MSTTILIIDDEAEVGRLLVRLLDPQFDDVTVVSTGEAGLELCRKRDFNAVLCDLHMPGISGVEFYQQVAEERPEMAERIAFLTGGSFTPDTDRFLRTTKNPVLYKPFTQTELLAIIDVVCDSDGQ